MPGRFDAMLDIRSDGTFNLRYKGELMFVTPGPNIDPSPEIWDESKLYCHDEGADAPRACNVDEIAEKKQDFDERQWKERKESEAIAKILGFTPFDEAANAKLAKRWMQFKGWKRVEYRGQGVYDVDYQIGGRLDRDLVFPVLPDTQVSLPFLMIQPSNNGEVAIMASGLGGGFLPTLLMEQSKTGLSKKELAYFERVRGTFTVTTDGRILSSNGKLRQGSDSAAEWNIEGAALIDRPGEFPNMILQLSQPNCCGKK
jgi:hypothetical protein